MRTLKLDFLHPVPRPHWLGWLLLGVGVAMAAWAGWKGEEAQSLLVQARAAAPKQHAAMASRSTLSTASESGLAKEQLSAPWDTLFVRLETSRPKGIALLALEADARKTEATLTAEARTTRDMLAYIELLKAEAGFASVTLSSHALQDIDPQQPLRFVLRLGWKT